MLMQLSNKNVARLGLASSAGAGACDLASCVLANKSGAMANSSRLQAFKLAGRATDLVKTGKWTKIILQQAV